VITVDNSGASRVLRGGSWLDASRSARSASRGDWPHPHVRFAFFGFRVVRPVPHTEH
jgi:formylglycine-generating enzyme required for sulfatase activity